MHYPPSSDSFDPLFTLSFRYGWHTLRRIFLLILLFTVILGGVIRLPALSGFIQWLLDAMVFAAAIFLLVIAFYRVDALWRATTLSWRESLNLTVKIILKIYLTCLLMALGCALIFIVGRWLVLFMGITGAPGGIAMALMMGIPMVVFLVFFYLTIPLLALYEPSLLNAFYNSAAIARRYFLPMLVLYAEITILLFISSVRTRHGQWLLSYHLMDVVNLIGFSVLLPLVINQTLLLLNDDKIKHGLSHFR